MVTAGVLNDIVRSLQVSVALGGQLIGAAAVVMAFGSPLLAGRAERLGPAPPAGAGAAVVCRRPPAVRR